MPMIHDAYVARFGGRIVVPASLVLDPDVWYSMGQRGGQEIVLIDPNPMPRLHLWRLLRRRHR